MPRSLIEAVFMAELLNHSEKEIWMLYAIVVAKTVKSTAVESSLALL